MNCPNNHKELMQKILFHQVEVDYCPECLGIWFDYDELRLAKDEKDEQLNWLDFDVWRDKGKFVVSPSDKRCPKCRIPLVEVAYDNSKVKIDYCKNCKGIWLDRGEFKQIVVYLKQKSDYEILHHYAKNLAVQLWEVFTGPEKFRSELEDFLMVVKLFNYKFVVQHPVLNAMIEDLPK
ncbi:zf-TFIIB domain-containing protein [Candidatus Parcubacteria bacterium]|nr:zf-TFIIB domain-containing protein [Candidatus Parcubacteria bacterium]